MQRNLITTPAEYFQLRGQNVRLLDLFLFQITQHPPGSVLSLFASSLVEGCTPAALGLRRRACSLHAVAGHKVPSGIGMAGKAHNQSAPGR